MIKPELLAPAKDLKKAKFAIDYGADAVYIGGKMFSLRSRASNFELEDIKEIVEYAHERKRKVYVTMNIVFHDEDFEGVKEYIIALRELKVDALIISSIGLVQIVKSVAPELECHISTQLSSLNSESVGYLKSFGADRVVLGRECSINEIKQIAWKNICELEVFIHGGMCSNYSGRCTLSNRMTNRDANKGGCAHSCRWKYRVYKGDEEISDKNVLFSLSSKDLRASSYIEEMMKANVASLKIEGRMKSEYYIAQVVKTYREMIDEIYEKGHLEEERLAYYDAELDKAENRPSDDGFLSGECSEDKHLYGVNGAGVTHDYVGLVKNYDETRNLALVEVKNIFVLNDTLEVFGPDLPNTQFKNTMMFSDEWKLLNMANKPTSLVYMRLPAKVKKGYMIRKVRS